MTNQPAQAALVRAAASFVRDTYSGEWADDAAATLETDADLIERGEPCSLLRLAETMQPAAVSAAVAPPTNPTHGLSVPHADALWDAIAIPGPHTPTYPEQHERVCRAVRNILDELTPARDEEADQTALRDRIDQVIREFPFDDFGLDDVSYLLESTPDTQEWVPKLAAAVLAELPSAADWDALVREADRLRRDGKALHARAEELDTQLAALRQQVTKPADRDAVLREVADELTRKANKLTERVHDLAYFVAKDRLREAEILDREATALRRMADETATETPAPSMRERHRAAWHALTPDQQTARLAELDAIDEPAAEARQNGAET